MWADFLCLYPNNPELFWDLTPQKYLVMMRAGNKRQIYDRNLLMEMAWTSAVLPRMETIPELDKLTYTAGDARKLKPVSDDDMDAALIKALDKLNAQLDEEAESR